LHDHFLHHKGIKLMDAGTLNITIKQILRVIHIYSGVFWAGTGLFFAGFLGRAVKAVGPDGGKVMSKINEVGLKGAFPAAAGLTMLSGLILYGMDVAAFGSFKWANTLPGIILTIGALTGIAAGIIGGALLGRTSAAMDALGKELQQTAGGKPPADKIAQMAALQERMERFTGINAILLTIAIICMAVGGGLL
jgi:hypothetical protein